MPYEGERPATPTELHARGLAPGPLGKMDPATPTINEQAVKDKVELDVVGRQKAALADSMTRMMQQAGKSPEDIQATRERILGKLPGTVAQLGGMAVPWAVGSMIRGGRTLPRIAGQVLGNIGGRAATEGASELLKPSAERDVMAGVVRGAAKGVLPGAAQGTIAGMMGPSRGTLQAQKAIESIKGEASPHIAAFLDPTKPGELFKKGTPRAMQKAASDVLEKAEEAIAKRLGPLEFKPPSRVVQTKFGPYTTGGTFQELRDEIKRLRDIGDKAFMGPAGMASQTARSARTEARQLEQELLAEMEQKGFTKEAQMYRQATGQYAKDKEVIRYVQGKQAERALPGGASVQDRPGLGKAEQALEGTGGKGKAAVHGALGAAEAAIGRPIGAGYQLGRASDALRAGRAVKPVAEKASLKPPMAPGAVGADIASLLQGLMF